ncbi:MAG: DNA polymerase/3'-5' exonuclease PolX [Spirochaetota bacterium]
MPVKNSDVVDIFNRVADLLELDGANQFRVRAYRNAARTISALSRSIGEMVENGEELTVLPGVGKDLAEKIEEIVKTGSLRQLRELERKVPPELIALMSIPSLGPKRVRLLYTELGIKDEEQLMEAARDGKIREIAGFGDKTERRILEEIERLRQRGERGRLKLMEAERITEPLLEYLSKIEGVKRVEAAGSYRRRRETVGDLDILVVCEDSSDVMESFVQYDDVKRVLSKGETRSSVILKSDFQVDVRVVPEESYGAALHYFTGSQAHNIAIRKLGQSKDLKVNEYGVFRGEKRIAGRTEEEVYAELGLPFIAPELRENRGEIEAAFEGKLPGLITINDIRGDFQCHTKASDGRASLEEIAEAAMKRGYEYIAITDHSRRVTVARGLDEKRLAQQMEEIERINSRMKGFRLLKSIEVDILEDGSLDLSRDILKELDLVVGAIHYNLNLPGDKQTERILRAMGYYPFHILSHPTGRIIGGRGPCEMDLEKVMEACTRTGCILEINAQPERLDLNDINARMAKEMGVKLAISTDAHSVADLNFMKYGVWQARRGWLEPYDVINTLSLEELEKLFRNR